MAPLPVWREQSFRHCRVLRGSEKGLEEISGDTFLMKDLPGGRKGVALSDGMGSGEEAFRDSTMVVEMLEELLEPFAVSAEQVCYQSEWRSCTESHIGNRDPDWGGGQ